MSAEPKSSGKTGKFIIITVVAVILAVGAAWYYSRRQADLAELAKVRHLTDGDFSQQVQSGVTIVDFWAEWCGPCHMQAPVIDKLAVSFAGRAKVAKVDVDANPGIARQLGISGIPTLVVFKDGKIAEHFVGVQSEEVLTKALNDALR